MMTRLSISSMYVIRNQPSSSSFQALDRPLRLDVTLSGSERACTIVSREIFRTGMTDEVFAWTAASNNQAFLAGRLSVALNAISIVRSA
jgi:hypothetical protein